MFNVNFSDDVMAIINYPRCKLHNGISCRRCPDRQKCYTAVMRKKWKLTYADRQVVQFLRGLPDIYGPRDEYA